MKIIQPDARLLNPATLGEGILALQTIEYAARISHRSEDLQTVDSWKRFLQEVVINHGDWSVVEHATASVLFRMDRGLTHEIVRHRLFSYTQESTRFVRYGGKQVSELEFIIPSEVDKGTDAYDLLIISLEHSEKCYHGLLKQGVRPQAARAVLPTATAATIQMTGNFRAWRWFFLARATKQAHPDLRLVVDNLLACFQQRIPLLYDDIVPGERQITNMEKAS